ncbi:MAG: lytic transglycosylase, partial [Hydrogenophilales bacterium 17-61-9]
MPGIRTAETRIASTRSKPGLTLLLLLFSLPAFAAESTARIQTLEWHGDAPSPPLESGAVSEAYPDDVWQRIRNGFKIDEAASENPLVATHVAWYAARPDYVLRMVDRSRRYLFHIVQEVDRRSMPMEIALLPMIESAFNSNALSTSAASGIWQFMPATGRHYGLKQDAWYDGRRDFTAATHAALDYLDKLYLDFGDWQLALAAYNCGEGCVARAIQKNVSQGLATDYASLTLPNETRHYVPKLLAVKNMIRHPEQFGVAIDSLPNQPYFNQVAVHAGMDIHAAARLADMSSNDFIALNAAFPRKLIRSDTPVNLLVPVDKADQFKRNLETKTWDSWQPVAVQKGDRLETIARRFNVTIERLKEYNLFNLKRGKLVQAQTILVPVSGRGRVAPAPAATVSRAEGAHQHQVASGDTLYGVARRYGLNVARLAQANPHLDGGLQIGQTLFLPLNEPAVPTRAAIQHVAFNPDSIKPAQAVHYTVRRGDTLHSIAQRFDASLLDIKRWNPG